MLHIHTPIFALILTYNPQLFSKISETFRISVNCTPGTIYSYDFSIFVIFQMFCDFSVFPDLFENLTYSRFFVSCFLITNFICNWIHFSPWSWIYLCWSCTVYISLIACIFIFQVQIFSRHFFYYFYSIQPTYVSLFSFSRTYTLHTHPACARCELRSPPYFKKQVKKCILWVIFSNLRCRFVAYSVNCLIGYIVFVATWFIVSLLLSFSRACRQGIKVPYFWW